MSRIRKSDVPNEYTYMEWLALRNTLRDQWFILKEYLLYKGTPTQEAELTAYDYLGVSYLATVEQIKKLVKL